MTLYEISNEIVKIIDANVNEDGEIIGGEEELNALQMAYEEKVENIGLFIKNLLSDAEAIKAEKMALAKRQAQAEAKAKWLKEYLGYYLNGQTFNSPRVAISWRKSEQVKCDDIKAVPDEYLKYKDPELDKTAIKKAIKAGEETGCYLETVNNIQIK